MILFDDADWKAAERITVEHQLVKLEYVLRLQESLRKQLPDFKPKQPHRLHLTTLHFGVAKEVYEEVAAVNQKLTVDMYLARLTSCLQRFHDVVQSIRNGPIVNTVGLDLFGQAAQTQLVLRVDDRRGVFAYRSELINILMAFLHDCGIVDVDLFTSRSPNFRFDVVERFQPHITLGEISSENYSLQDQGILPQIGLTPPRLMHVRAV